MNQASPPMAAPGANSDRIVRHALTDRLIHWLTAISVIVLLATAFLPILGIDFAWVAIHWVAGWILIAVVLVHIVRSVFWQDLMSMWIDAADVGNAIAIAKQATRLSAEAPLKPGKYSFAQKAIHFGFGVVVIAACVTGALMMVKIDTRWWDRNPYWLSDPTWGVVYVIHGLAALLLITMVMAHIYFALRPEKWLFTRSMFKGWITRKEYAEQHDPNRWQVD